MMNKLLAAMLAASLLTACHAEPKMLGITGYNYTNRYIDSFSVDGHGGSNVLLSEDDSGGGKTSCCILFRPGASLPMKVHVEWTYGEDQDLRTGKIYKPRVSHEADVELKGPIPKEPTIFVVHFYPDNTVQVEVAADYPEPRIKRSKLNKTGTT